MGDFRLVVELTGGHGCKREVKDGGDVSQGCGYISCPDCQFREFVKHMSLTNTLRSASIVHWPGQTSEVRDEFGPSEHRGYIRGTRHGSF